MITFRFSGSLLTIFLLGGCASSSSPSPSQQPEIWLGPARVQQVLELAGQYGLVEVKSRIPDVQYDLLYRKRKNVAWQPLYPQDMPCLLHHGTAEKLRLAQEYLSARGYGLKIWDAWRPPEVQVSLYEHGGYTGMFTPPSVGWSRHCSGTAVDVTLVDARGNELEMPTGFDEGTPQAHYTALAVPPEVAERRVILQTAMMTAGFSLLDIEWWHFEDSEFNTRPVPPVVYASEIGLSLPVVKKRR